MQVFSNDFRPGADEWVIACHRFRFRFRIPGGNGYNRETCLSPLRHNEDGRIPPVDVFEPASLSPRTSCARPSTSG